MLPVVALVGRPNVGKSTLFNVLTRTRDALVADLPGVTRDRHYGVCRLVEGQPFVVIDTGGLVDDAEGLAAQTAGQVDIAIAEADIVLLIVDARRSAPTTEVGAGSQARGYLPVVPDGGSLFFQLVNARYERGAMILTSNRGFAEWGEIFDDTIVGTALLDRLLHHARVASAPRAG